LAESELGSLDSNETSNVALGPGAAKLDAFSSSTMAPEKTTVRLKKLVKDIVSSVRSRRADSRYSEMSALDLLPGVMEIRQNSSHP
jgi:hypothetical protein